MKVNISKTEIQRLWLISQETGAELKEDAIYTFSILLAAKLSKHLDNVYVHLTDT